MGEMAERGFNDMDAKLAGSRAFEARMKFLQRLPQKPAVKVRVNFGGGDAGMA